MDKDGLITTKNPMNYLSLLLLGEAKRKVPGHDESGGGEAGLDDHQHHHHLQDQDI